MGWDDVNIGQVLLLKQDELAHQSILEKDRSILDLNRRSLSIRLHVAARVGASTKRQT